MQYKDNLWNKIKRFVNEHKKLAWIIISIVGITVISLVIALIMGNIKKNTIENSTLTLDLIGSEEVTVYLGEEYVEYGYTAWDAIDDDITDKVEVDLSNLDVSEIGEYVVKYSVTNSKNITDTASRKVTVKKASEKRTEFNLILKGSMVLELSEGEEYNEPGYSAYDNVDGNLTNNVEIIGEIDTNEISEQILTYSVTNSNGDVIYKERVINVKANNIYMDLVGSAKVTITKGSNYTDSGCYAYDNETEITNNISYIGSVNTKESGTYNLKCILNYNNKTITKERTVIVEDGENTSTNGDLLISLNGENKVTITRNSKYIDPGANAYDSIDGNITNEIVKYGNIDTTKLGTYNIIYTISNSTGITKYISRQIEVIESEEEIEKNNLKITFTFSTTELVNDKVVITGIITGKNYRKAVLPDLSEISNTSFIYEITSNGTYGFKLYNTLDNTYKTYSVFVNNIDKDGPTGSCVLDINKSEATITVKAQDEKSTIGGYKYKLTGGTYSEYVNSNVIKLGYNNEENAFVTVKDSLGNESNEIQCSLGKAVYAPVQIKGKLYKSATSDSLIIRIIKQSGIYYSYVWAENPHLQLRKYSASDSNKKYDRISDLLDAALSRAKTNSGASLKNKIVLAFNNDMSAYSSCFYCGWPKYATTSLVVNNGIVLRNDPKSNERRHKFAGIGIDNKLLIYNEDKNPSERGEDYIVFRKNLYEKALANKIKNTISGLYILLDNAGKIRTSYTKTSATRQAICMLNNNNYIQFTTTKSIKLAKLTTIGINLGCKVMMNMDGGGSRALYFKTQKKSSWTKFIKTYRGPYYSILYWTEL